VPVSLRLLPEPKRRNESLVATASGRGTIPLGALGSDARRHGRLRAHLLGILRVESALKVVDAGQRQLSAAGVEAGFLLGCDAKSLKRRIVRLIPWVSWSVTEHQGLRCVPGLHRDGTIASPGSAI